LLLEIARSLVAAIVDFFRKLLDLMPARRPAKPREPGPPRPKSARWPNTRTHFTPARSISGRRRKLYFTRMRPSRAWAREQGLEMHPEQTAREFCEEMAARSPELAGAYRHLSY
jgi:hypothetical protein